MRRFESTMELVYLDLLSEWDSAFFDWESDTADICRLFENLDVPMDVS